jgi:hypothetical protein
VAKGLSIGVVFWGSTFCNYFLDYCLPSLLAEGNIPAIENKTDSLFLVCTTDEDWKNLKEHPVFVRLEAHIPVSHISFALPDSREAKMASMSRGHLTIARAMYERQTHGVYVYPDTVFSDGVLRMAQMRAAEGWPLVLVHCPRLSNEGFLAALGELGLCAPGLPIALDGRQLLAVALPNMHSEVQRFEWSKDTFFADAPSAVFWRSKDGNKLLFHTLSWAPILVDYAAFPRHDTSTLEQWTIDGDYVFRNLPDPTRAYCVLDSDEATLISFTPEAMMSYFPLRVQPAYRLPFVGQQYRLLAMRHYMNSSAIDPLKRALFMHQVRTHTGSESRKEEKEMSLKAYAIASSCLKPLTCSEVLLYKVLRVWNDGLTRRLRAWGRALSLKV